MDIEARTITIGGMSIDLVRKSIENLHLAVYPPDGRIRVAAPWHVSEDAIRVAVATRVAWINRQRRKFLVQDRQSKREYVSGETHYFLGRGYRLQLNQDSGSFRIRIAGSNKIELHTPLGANRDDREQAILRWYRRELRKRALVDAQMWAARLGFETPRVGIKRMRTKWGTSNPEAQRIWLNLELAQKHPQCISYIVLHEIAHFKFRKHDEAFLGILDLLMPKWRAIKSDLNQFPLAFQEWSNIPIE